ncbi:hypothetical protein MC7420_7171 [Coleofasciculus chthonoplastes PCC 7420]|uniref:Uncharacterized protein n=1 Tax=Coleofasciculus chthonoplastes PCC 7420 TaxID=118168 RepID=B4VHS6_9CYAN|nr:hypothetical protein MC7420_7171 [Coleofasciculus chthonoplastes PCC 7420]
MHDSLVARHSLFDELSGWTQLKLTVEIREQGTGNREQ